MFGPLMTNEYVYYPKETIQERERERELYLFEIFHIRLPAVIVDTHNSTH